MHALCMCTWSNGSAGFYAIFVNYLRYFYGLFMLFAQNDLCPTREVGCWTRSLTRTRGEVDLVHEQEDTYDRLTWGVGARAGTVQPAEVVSKSSLYIYIDGYKEFTYSCANEFFVSEP